MIKRDTFGNFGSNIFPSATADRKGRQIGQTPFRRCVQCGMPNDTRKTSWSAQGEGLNAATDVTVTAVPGQAHANTKDRAVTSGCRFCGSLKWQPSKPDPLPDDRTKPSDEWRSYRRRNKRRR